jgi:hypothetical protein
MMTNFDFGGVLVSQRHFIAQMRNMLVKRLEECPAVNVASVSVVQSQRKRAEVPDLPRDGTMYEVRLKDTEGNRVRLAKTWFLQVVKTEYKVVFHRCEILSGTVTTRHPPRRR